MLRRTWILIAMLAAGVSLTLAASIRSETTAVAQDIGDGRSKPADRLLTEGLTREQIVHLYGALALGRFEPPACVAGMAMFDDVPVSSPFCPWIEELARRGITKGCTADSYCPGAPVTRAQMAVFVVRATADEDFHVVGAPGEPAFNDGGEGDCLWQNPPPKLISDVNPVSFLKNSDGIVRLAGFPMAIEGEGGDMDCDVIVTDAADVVIFELPAGYRPEHLEVFPSSSNGPGPGQLLIAPVGGVMVGGVFVPGGSVFVTNIEDGRTTSLDGITFRAAAQTAASNPAHEPADISLRALRDLLG